MNREDLPDFTPQTRVFIRGSDDYEQNAYQYATSSNKKGSMEPMAIIYPKNVNDIIAAVNYARNSSMGIAVRTGGHQYSGASSTSGNNLQLDLSDTFQSPVRDFRYNHEAKLLRLGVSFSVLELNKLLANMKMFVPTGICSHVHVGGHAQTGGYGMLTRSFGLFSDTIEGFEIVLANGKHEKIWRPSSPYADAATVEENDDLFWAVLGGSPGNYGVLTHLHVRPFHDDDYPDSRGMKVYTPYTKEKLEKCAQILAEMSDNSEFPRDFDYGIIVLTDITNSFYFHNAFKHEKENLGIDAKMMLEYPEQYGDGVPQAEDAKLDREFQNIPLIIIYCQWANVGGIQEKFGEEEVGFFEKLREQCGTLVDGPLDLESKEVKLNFVKTLIGDPSAEEYEKLLYTTPRRMSEIAQHWTMQDVREYIYPFEKRCYMSDRTDLSTNNWVKWISERIDVIASGYQGNDTLSLVVQLLNFGGKNSRYSQIGIDNPQDSSHSWRSETTICVILDGFYDPKDPTALQTLLEYQAVNDEEAKEGGIFCDKDRRHLWGSYHRADDEDGGAVLDSVWDKYFDSKEKYDKLVDIKRKVDPDYVFTANMFGVDASNAPDSKKRLILGASADMQGKCDSSMSPSSEAD